MAAGPSICILRSDGWWRWRRSVATLGLIWLLASTAPAAAAEGGAFEPVSFLVGDWSSHWSRLPGVGVQHDGPIGRTHVTRGGGGAWLELHSAVTLPDGEDYEVVVLVARGQDPDLLRAFVVNSSGSAAEYRGRALDEGALEFEASLGSKVQRVTYRQLPDDRVHFYVEESVEGADFEPHSEAVWHRSESVSDGPHTADRPVYQSLPPIRLFSHSVVGPYSLHQEVLAELMDRSASLGLQPTKVVALHLTDPEVTPADELRWSLGVVIDEDREIEVEPPFTVVELADQEVYSIQTSFDDLANASQQIDEWMASAGLRQTGPTRIVWEVGPETPTSGSVELVKPAGVDASRARSVQKAHDRVAVHATPRG